jgi:hypothetical protein
MTDSSRFFSPDDFHPAKSIWELFVFWAVMFSFSGKEKKQ